MSDIFLRVSNEVSVFRAACMWGIAHELGRLIDFNRIAKSTRDALNGRKCSSTQSPELPKK